MMVFSQTWMMGKLWKVETGDPIIPIKFDGKKCKKHPWISGEDFPIYPPVNIQKAIENGHRNS